MRQIRFNTNVEITVDVPDSFFDPNEPDPDLAFDQDAVANYGAERANAYLQTLTGEAGLRVSHLGMDALQDAEIVEPDDDSNEDSPIPEKQQDILLSILLGRPYGASPSKVDVDWLIMRFFVERSQGGLLTLTESGQDAAEKIRQRILADAGKSLLKGGTS